MNKQSGEGAVAEVLPATLHKAVELAGRLLREGEVVAFPTDTLYGVGADAFDRFAVRRIFAVKKRPPNKLAFR